MKISRRWLEDYIDIPLDDNTLSEVLTSLGLEVEGQESVESIPGGLQGVVIGQVLTCNQHPNADRLSVCTVDTGAETPLYIVCGAPNVAAGQKVLVATIGTTLYSPEGEAWKIKKGKIRGEMSEGMICAEDELSLGSSHDGIMVLDTDLAPGTAATELFPVETDTVYEIGLTPNRSDATSHYGVAKDLAAWLTTQGHQPNLRQGPGTPLSLGSGLDIDVQVLNTEACPRYAGVCLDGINIAPSPAWMQFRLKAIGVRPISNIVDITNYILHSYGQPLHAFDYDKISNHKIIVDTLDEGTPFISLDEQERSLSSEDLMICDGNKAPMCIGGVFGGIGSGVKDQTTRIFLESAHFNAKYIRRSSTRHQLRTDAAKVFEKGSDPNLCVLALQSAVKLMNELTSSTIASEFIDIYPQTIEPVEIELRLSRVKLLIGHEFTALEVEGILSAMGMEFTKKDNNSWTVRIPTDKADVTREADLIEEIIRIYGLNNVAIEEQVTSRIVDDGSGDFALWRNKIGEFLAHRGYLEMMGLSLTSRKSYAEILGLDEGARPEEWVYVNNTSNRDLDIMRPDMLGLRPRIAQLQCPPPTDTDEAVRIWSQLRHGRGGHHRKRMAQCFPIRTLPRGKPAQDKSRKL